MRAAWAVESVDVTPNWMSAVFGGSVHWGYGSGEGRDAGFTLAPLMTKAYQRQVCTAMVPTFAQPIKFSESLFLASPRIAHRGTCVDTVAKSHDSGTSK